MHRHISLLLLLSSVILAGCAHMNLNEQSEPILEQSFEQNPTKAGWQCVDIGRYQADGCWTDETAASGSHSVVARSGAWQSPEFKVKPFQYYDVRFSSRADENGYWAVVFYDSDGNRMTADQYSGVDASKEWVRNRACAMAEKGAVAARVIFQARESSVWVDDVSVRPTARSAVAEWADEAFAELPPLQYEPSPDRWKHLWDTRQKLRNGGTLRVVMLGDSIVNDTANSPFDVLVERAYEGVKMRVISAVRGATGCWYYREKDRVEPYVVRHDPDLLIIGGVSHRDDVESIASVIDQVRKRIDPDILVMTGALGQTDADKVARYRKGLEEMCKQKGVGFLDMRRVWNRYESQQEGLPALLRRDPVHANTRGHQILARIMARFFKPNN